MAVASPHRIWHAPAKSVAVLERGREVLTGNFPAKFPDLKNDFQVRAKSFTTGPDTALFDVRIGEDMHVLVGRGLGGGSLVNAGVTLRPDHRVFEDEIWPGRSGRMAPSIAATRAPNFGCVQPAIHAPGDDKIRRTRRCRPQAQPRSRGAARRRQLR